jgi:hypothetical protein
MEECAIKAPVWKGLERVVNLTNIWFLGNKDLARSKSIAPYIWKSKCSENIMFLFRTISKKINLYLLIILSILLSGCISVNQHERVIHEEGKIFLFDSINLLTNIENGNRDLFKFVRDYPKKNEVNLTIPIKWNQSDYLKIAEKIQEDIWGKTNKLGDLASISLQLDCSDIEQGMYSSAWIDFIDNVNYENGEKRIEYRNYIYPLENYGSTTKVEYFPSLYKSELLEIQKLNITAEKALQIAENNGGSKVRQEVKNACRISAIVTGLKTESWRISYVNVKDAFTCYFRININSYTGESKAESCGA